MKGKTYYRYIWLLNTLVTSGPLTYEKIKTLWEENPTGNGNLPLRTFHEHRQGVKEMFGVEITCDRSKGNVYFIKNPEILNNNKLAKWLLHSYSVPEDFFTFNSMKERILLEEIPFGTSFIASIIEAMQKNVDLSIDYQKYGNNSRESFHIQPYALKVFNRRWYLLGYIEEKKDLRTIALDRIIDLNVLQTSFELPANFDAQKYFTNVVGVYVDHDLSVVKVKIRVYGTQVEYFRSLPLHKSQAEVLTKYGEYSEFTYRLCKTPELVSQLLAMGNKVEVLEPKELREDICKHLQSALDNYKS